MMTEVEAKRVLAHLIQHSEGYDWLKCNKFDPSVDAIKLAVGAMPKWSTEHIGLDKAVKGDLQAKQIRFYWLVKSLALALDDDSNGNHITFDVLEQARKYRVFLQQKAVVV